MVKKIILFSLFILFLITLVSATPRIEPYVNDFTNSLTREQTSTLNLLADKIEQNTSWEIAMVMVPDTEGMDRLDYANKLGDENGVGKKDKDNGIVVLWSEGADRGIAIATGRYSESVFNDAKVGRIARAARPYFDNQEYYEGFRNITLELQMEIDGTLIATEFETDDWFWVFIFGGIVIFIIVIIGSVINYDYSSSSSGSRSSSSSSSVFSGSSGSRSGGFGGSFGHGSFGGGGAKG